MVRNMFSKLMKNDPTVEDQEPVEEQDEDEDKAEYECAKKEADEALQELKRTVTRRKMKRYEETGENSGAIPVAAALAHTG